MKRVWMLLLAAALAVSLAACGGTETEADPDTGAETAEEAADPAAGGEDAVDATAAPTVLDEDAYLTGLVERQHTNGLPEGAKGIAVYGLELAKADNPARLAQDYGGQFCQISGIVFSIESDGIVLGYTQFNASGDLGAIGANGGVKVELSADDLASLSALDDVTVTGTFQADDSGTWAAILTDGAVVA